MKPENKFRIWFTAKAIGYLAQKYPGLKVRFQKHADHVTSGVPDIDVGICGITLWLEVKLFMSLTKERILDVSALQLDYVRGLTDAGIPAGVLVGRSLGPRMGYDVALYDKAIPSVSLRDDFRPWTIVVDQMVAMAKDCAGRSHHILSQIGPHRPSIVGHLPVLLPVREAAEVDLDSADEDGG